MKSTRLPLFIIIATLALYHCRADRRNDSETDGDSDGDSDGDGDSDSDSDSDSDGDGDGDTSNCVEAARWIYLVGSGRAFLRYYPDENRLEEIGFINCESGGATPFSMSVDRSAQAWVLHQDGRLYNVSTTDASCSATDYVPHQDGIELFGMGFVSLHEGSNDEDLYIAGGTEMDIATGSATLGFIDLSILELTTIGGIPGWPELTGTGRGELWGFFPDTVPPSIRQINKETGTSEQTFELTPLSGSTPSAWAFAFWGGQFYVFLMRFSDRSTHIWKFNPETGDFVDYNPNIGYRIVGAGVSTCAPVELY